MKRIVICFVACVIASAAVFAQNPLASRYRSISVIGHYQTSAYPVLTGEDYEMTHPFNIEFGFNYQVQLGHTSLYFDTGVYLGQITAKFKEDKGEGGYTTTETEGFRLKLPICFDYIINVSKALIIYPSFGVGVTLESQDYKEITLLHYGYSDWTNEGSGSQIAFGGLLPHLGLNAIINDKIVLGVGWEQYWNTGQMPIITSVLFKAGIAF